MESLTVDLDGPVHYVDHGGTGPVLVLVHGLGGSHTNWHDLAPRLTSEFHVYAVDLAGHGRTERLGRSSSIRANRRLLDRFLTEVVGGPAVLIGNSMGGMLSILEAAAKPDRVAGLVLIAPAVPRVNRERPDLQVAKNFALLAIPGLGERVMTRRRRRVPAEQQVQETLALCMVDPSRVSPELRQVSIELVRERADWLDVEAGFLEAARSLMTLMMAPARYRSRIKAVTAPTLVIAGRQDRLVPLSAIRQLGRLRPDWTVEVFDDVGHVPQIEAPEQTAETIRGWFAADGAVALKTAVGA